MDAVSTEVAQNGNLPIEAQVELALATQIPEDAILRLVSEPGIGRNASLKAILDERSEDVVYLDAWDLSAWDLQLMGEALAQAEYIVIDGLSHVPLYDREHIVELLVSRKVTTAPVKFQAGGGEVKALRDDVTIIVSDSEMAAHVLNDQQYVDMFVTVRLDTPVVIMLIDQADMPDYNPAANAGRGEWGLYDVSNGEVTAHPTDVVRCVEHGAMNSVSPMRTLWRCLTCGRAAYRLLPQQPKRTSA